MLIKAEVGVVQVGGAVNRSWISDDAETRWRHETQQLQTDVYTRFSLTSDQFWSRGDSFSIMCPSSCGFFSEWWSCNLQVWAARRAARIRWCLEVLMHWFHPRVDPAHRDSSRICEDVEDMMFCRSQWGTLFWDCSTVCRCRFLHIGEQLMMFLYLIMWRTCWKITRSAAAPPLFFSLFFPSSQL